MRYLAPLLGLSACMVGPDFVKPNVPLAPTWSSSRDPRLATETAAEIAWWRTFDDPALDRLIDLAYHQNLDLQVTALRIAEARARLGIAEANLFPTGGPTASLSATRLSEREATQFIDRKFGSFNLGFDASWELDFWGKLRRDKRAAGADLLATIADYDQALVSLSAEVARTYVEIRMYEMLIALAEENVVVEEEGVQIARARFANGATSELDVAQATNLLETTKASIPKYELGRQRAENALGTLLGRPPGYVRGLITARGEIPAPPPCVAISVPAEMMRRRPDIRGAELRALAQSERVGVATAEFYPAFTLFGFLGTHTTSAGGEAVFDGIFGPGSIVYNAGGSVLWPLLNYGRIKNNVRAERAKFEQTLVQYVDTVLRAAREVEDGISGYLREQDALLFTNNAVSAAETAVKLSLIQYREGAVDYQRVLDSQRALVDSQTLMVQTRSAAVTNLIALYKALGGGWEQRLPRGR